MTTSIERTMHWDRCDVDPRQWVHVEAAYDWGRRGDRDHIYIRLNGTAPWPNIWPLPIYDLRLGLAAHVRNADGHGSAWTVEPVDGTDGTTRIRIETGERSAEYEVATDSLRRLLDDIAAARAYRSPQAVGDAA